MTPCTHTWPSELGPGAACELCGLPYADWSEEGAADE